LSEKGQSANNANNAANKDKTRTDLVITLVITFPILALPKAMSVNNNCVIIN